MTWIKKWQECLSNFHVGENWIRQQDGRYNISKEWAEYSQRKDAHAKFLFWKIEIKDTNTVCAGIPSLTRVSLKKELKYKRILNWI